MICFASESGSSCFVDIGAVCAIAPAPPMKRVKWDGNKEYVQASYLMFSGGGTIHVEGSPTVVHKLIRDNKGSSDN